MKRIVLFAVLLFAVPFAAQAEYTFYLQNGAEVPAVQTYTERGDEVTLYFSAGSMVIPKQDILRIEGSEATEEGEVAPDTQAEQEKKEEASGQAQGSGEADERTSALNRELDSVRTEIRAVEKQEMDLVATINEKIGSDRSYNLIQRRQLEKELEPLNRQLSEVQNRKAELLKKRSSLEDQRSLLQETKQ